MDTQFHYSDEVRAALQAGRAVVALESTIISHGMPYPDNLHCALAVERIVREGGAVPATIAIMDGKICVGLTEKQIDTLARKRLENAQVRKTSRRDVALALARNEDGATTVAGTMVIAQRAGLDIFVTGGVGGVHRGAETTMDVSADLQELGRTPICVVCAGVKSILDIPLTLEVLETQGVTVCGYGTTQFPAFFTPDSGSKAPCGRLDSPEECAKIVIANKELNLGSGMLIGCPIPDSAAAQAQVVEAATQQVLAECQAKNIAGAEITPYILKRVGEITGGASLAANVALIKNNAYIGSRIAVAVAKLRQSRQSPPSTSVHSHSHNHDHTHTKGAPHPPPKVVVVGGSALDLVARVDPAYKDKKLATSVPGHLSQSPGGVGRNIAECASRLLFDPSSGVSPVTLLSRVGGNSIGQGLLDTSAESGMDVSQVDVAPHTNANGTATYTVVVDGTGEVACAVADMEILDEMHPSYISSHMPPLLQHTVRPILVVDANFSEAILKEIASSRKKAPGVLLWFEPTSVSKCTKAVTSGLLSVCDIASPSLEELLALAKCVLESQPQKAHLVSKIQSFLQSHQPPPQTVIEDCCRILNAAGCRQIVVTMGAAGSLYAAPKSGSSDLEFVHMPAHPVEKIVNTTGAGDCLVGGTVAALSSGLNIHASLEFGSQIASIAIQSAQAVPESLNPGLLIAAQARVSKL